MNIERGRNNEIVFGFFRDTKVNLPNKTNQNWGRTNQIMPGNIDCTLMGISALLLLLLFFYRLSSMSNLSVNNSLGPFPIPVGK